MTRVQTYFKNRLTSILPLFILMQFFRLLALPDYDKPELKIQVLVVLGGLGVMFLLLRMRVIRRVVISAGGIELIGHQWGYLPVREYFAWQEDDKMEIVYNGGRSSHGTFRLKRGEHVYPLLHVIGGLRGDKQEAGAQMAVVLEKVTGRKWDSGMEGDHKPKL
jgi:hypothetical protein